MSSKFIEPNNNIKLNDRSIFQKKPSSLGKKIFITIFGAIILFLLTTATLIIIGSKIEPTSTIDGLADAFMSSVTTGDTALDSKVSIDPGLYNRMDTLLTESKSSTYKLLTKETAHDEAYLLFSINNDTYKFARVTITMPKNDNGRLQVSNYVLSTHKIEAVPPNISASDSSIPKGCPVPSETIDRTFGHEYFTNPNIFIKQYEIYFNPNTTKYGEIKPLFITKDSKPYNPMNTLLEYTSKHNKDSIIYTIYTPLEDHYGSTDSVNTEDLDKKRIDAIEASLLKSNVLKSNIHISHIHSSTDMEANSYTRRGTTASNYIHVSLRSNCQQSSYVL